MKIERISDTQVKFILTQSDLDERDIKINELAYGSEKTHKLFQDMMRKAYSECDFESENTPLMVEAMPVASGHLVVVVTKLGGMAEQPINLYPNFQDGGHFKTHGLIAYEQQGVRSGSLSIFSFACLDDVADACKRLMEHYFGRSRLYKYNARYYLVLRVSEQVQAGKQYSMTDIESVLLEYGEKQSSNDSAEFYLSEYGEILIKNMAVERLAQYF